MPLLFVGALGFAGGFFVGDGLDGAGKLVKWGVIGTGAYMAAKHFKVI